MQNPLSFTTSEDCLSPKGHKFNLTIPNSNSNSVQQVINQRVNILPFNIENEIIQNLEIPLGSSPASPLRDHRYTKELEQKEQTRRSGGVLYKMLARENSRTISNLISHSSVNLRGSSGIKRITAKQEEQERSRRLEDKEGAATAQQNAREVSACISDLGWPGFVQGPQSVDGDDCWCDVPLSGELRRRASLSYESSKATSAWSNIRYSSSPAFSRLSPAIPPARQSSPASDRRLSKTIFAFSPSCLIPDNRSSSPRSLSNSPRTTTSVTSEVIKTPTASPSSTHQHLLSQSDSLVAPITPIAKVSSLARVAALALEESGNVVTTEWVFSPKKPVVSPKPAFIHSLSHESGLVSPKRPASRSFSFKELRNITHSVSKHEKNAEREVKKAEKFDEKAEKFFVKGKLNRAEESRNEAAYHRQEAQKYMRAAHQEKAKVTADSTMSRKVLSSSFAAVAGSPAQ